MDFFSMNKYQSIEENLLYDAKILYSLLDINKPKHVDEIFSEFATRQGIVLSMSIERILFLSLSFLYAMNLATSESNMIKRV